MLKEFKLKDIRSDGFLHSRVYELYYEPEKLFKVNFGFADLIQGGAIVDCTISIVTVRLTTSRYAYHDSGMATK